MTTIRVTCDCEHCTEYAQRKGYATPLAADVNDRMAKACGITQRNANKAGKTHGLVASAYDPMSGNALQSKFGPWKVRR